MWPAPADWTFISFLVVKKDEIALGFSVSVGFELEGLVSSLVDFSGDCSSFTDLGDSADFGGLKGDFVIGFGEDLVSFVVFLGLVTFGDGVAFSFFTGFGFFLADV